MKKKFPEIIKDIDLNSIEWCNIIFKGKNKRYGAYALRRDSSLRHVRAMAIMLISIFVMLIVPVIATTEDPIEERERVAVVEFGSEINKPEKEQKIELMDPVYVNVSMMTMVAVEFVSNIEYIEVDQTPKSATEESDEEGGGRRGDDNGLNASLKDSKGTDAGSIYDEVERINRSLAEGQANYARQMQELDADRGGKSGGKGSREGGTKGSGTGSGSGEGKGGGASSDKGNKREVARGDVFVSYNLENRSDTYLYIPAYTCQYGGVVVVNITVNRSGKVISATVDKTTSTSGDCIMKMAVQSALASSFNSSSPAPDKQKGTITYRFAAQ